MIGKEYVWNKKPKYKASTRKQRRIAEHGPETELFLRIWNERPHVCENCGVGIPEPKAVCFAHILSKGRYPSLRYIPENIALVCSEECHRETDRKNAGNDFEIMKEITYGMRTKRRNGN